MDDRPLHPRHCELGYWLEQDLCYGCESPLSLRPDGDRLCLECGTIFSEEPGEVF